MAAEVPDDGHFDRDVGPEAVADDGVAPEIAGEVPGERRIRLDTGIETRWEGDAAEAGQRRRDRAHTAGARAGSASTSS